MLNRDFNALTVNGDCDLAVMNIFQGSPVTLGVNGYKLATKGDKLAGLSFNYFNQFRNDVTGGEFFANSGKIGVVKIGQVTLDKDVYKLAGSVNAKVSFTVTAANGATAGTAVVKIDGVDGATATIAASATKEAIATALAAAAPAGFVGAAAGDVVTFTKVEQSAIASTEAADNVVTVTTADATVGDAVIEQFKPAGQLFNVFPYDATQTYNIGDTLYVDDNGVITNDSSAADTDNTVGTVIEPATATKSAMKVYINIK